MKKLTAILNGRKIIDKLLILHEKEIRRKLDAAKDECEEKKVKAQIDYETAMKKLGDESVDYKRVLNDMIQAKQRITEAEDTLKAVIEIEKDLDSEAELESENDKQ